MLTEAKKVTRKKTLKSKSVEVSATPTNKHLKKLSRLSKLGFLPWLALDLSNKPAGNQFRSVEEVGVFLDKHALMYFDIPAADVVDFPEASKDFMDLFFILNKKYNSRVVNQDKAIPLNKYRSLGEIYLTFKFYYAKMSWKSFLKTLFTKFDKEALSHIESQANMTYHLNSPSLLASTICGVINRRVFSIQAASNRHLTYLHGVADTDEFGFTLKDYLDYIS